MNMLLLLPLAVISALILFGVYSILHRWNAKRRAAWEVERAGWRAWISRP